MKTLFYSAACFCLVLAGCHKDDEKPMTDKEFDRTVKLFFAGKWEVDQVDTQHKSTNAKSKGLAGKIEANYDFDKNGAYTLVYDTMVVDQQQTVTENGTWTIDSDNRRLYLYPGKITIKDKDKNETDLHARPSRYYGISTLTGEKLYLENYYKGTVSVINSEGVEVQESKDLSEILYFVADKKKC